MLIAKDVIPPAGGVNTNYSGKATIDKQETKLTNNKLHNRYARGQQTNKYSTLGKTDKQTSFPTTMKPLQPMKRFHTTRIRFNFICTNAFIKYTKIINTGEFENHDDHHHQQQQHHRHQHSSSAPLLSMLKVGHLSCKCVRLNVSILSNLLHGDQCFYHRVGHLLRNLWTSSPCWRTMYAKHCRIRWQHKEGNILLKKEQTR